MKKFYRTKLVEIEAIQWDGTTVSAVKIRDAFGATIQVGFLMSCPPIPYLHCLGLEEGRPAEAAPGDYIVKGIKGECYPCKPDIFEASYEEVLPVDCDDKTVATPLVPPKKRSCNRHIDCDDADKQAATTERGFASHCHDDCCEDCFGS